MKKQLIFLAVIGSIFLNPQHLLKGNLVVNSNFAYGANGSFTHGSLYRHPFCGVGTFDVLNNTDAKCYYAGVRDRSGVPSHFFMYINGYPSGSNQEVWGQTLNIMPSTQYTLSFWARTVAGPFPMLGFRVGGTQLPQVFTVSNTAGWSQFTATWNSGTNFGPVHFSILQLNSISTGHYFCLDDIEFSAPTPFVTCQILTPGSQVAFRAQGGGGVPPYTYHWVGMAGGTPFDVTSRLTPLFPNVAPVFGVVILTDAAGSTAMCSIGTSTCSGFSLSVDAVADATICAVNGDHHLNSATFTAQVSGGTPPYQYIWSGQTCYKGPGCQGPLTPPETCATVVAPTSSASLTFPDLSRAVSFGVTVLDATGCIISSTPLNYITVYDYDAMKSGVNPEPPGPATAAFSVYPSVTFDRVTAEFSSGDFERIRVMDVSGAVIREWPVALNTLMMELDISSFANGLYFFEAVSSLRKSETVKVIKM